MVTVEGTTLGERLTEARGTQAIDDVVGAYRQRHGKRRGLSRGSLSRWERNEGRPGLVILARLARLYERELEELADDEARAELVEIGFKSRGNSTRRRRNGSVRAHALTEPPATMLLAS